MRALRLRAPGKVNLCLFLGPLREDGRHELVTLFESVALYDELTVVEAERDHVECADVSAPNLVAGSSAPKWASMSLKPRFVSTLAWPLARGRSGVPLKSIGVSPLR